MQRIAPRRVLIAGWATDSCVDSTIRSAISNDYHLPSATSFSVYAITRSHKVLRAKVPG
ncbi:MAG: isochorismatase family protein [Alphaproteobacteria bacterium]|nr:isochorismatase family protein [Alphaproteobacteria bacterium]